MENPRAGAIADNAAALFGRDPPPSLPERGPPCPVDEPLLGAGGSEIVSGELSASASSVTTGVLSFAACTIAGVDASVGCDWCDSDGASAGVAYVVGLNRRRHGPPARELSVTNHCAGGLRAYGLELAQQVDDGFDQSLGTGRLWDYDLTATGRPVMAVSAMQDEGDAELI
jgi:hypothetical protein